MTENQLPPGTNVIDQNGVPCEIVAATRNNFTVGLFSYTVRYVDDTEREWRRDQFTLATMPQPAVWVTPQANTVETPKAGDMPDNLPPSY